MRFGVCIVPFGNSRFEHPWQHPHPKIESWRAARALGITDIRLQFNVGAGMTDEEPVSLHPDDWNTSLFRAFLAPAVAAGMKINANYCVGAPVPAHQDAAWHEQAAFAFAREFGPMIDSYSFGNEPGADAKAYEDVEVPPSSGGGEFSHLDYMRDVYFPKLCLPFARGVRRAVPNAWIIGCDADSADIQRRYTDYIDGNISLRAACDEEAVHPYGEVQDMAYATMAEFLRVKSHRPLGATEIDNRDPQKLFDFTERCVRGDYPGLTRFYFLFEGSEDYFFEPVEGGAYSSFYTTTPVVNASGRHYAELFAKVNGPVDPVRTTMPIGRRRSVTS